MKATSMFKGVLLVTMSFIVTSCVCRTKSFSGNDYEQRSEIRDLRGFEQIEINGSPTVYYSQADSFSVKVTGPSESVDDILTEVANGALTIRNRGKVGIFNVTFSDDGKIVVYITSPDMVGVRLDGSGDFICDNRVDTDKMDIILRGSGDISFKDIICDRCQVELVGSGDIAIERLEAESVSTVLVGSGDIRMSERNVFSTELHLKGSGDISADLEQGCKSVSCELEGSGDITLHGNVDHFSMQKSGSGEVEVDDLSIRD